LFEALTDKPGVKETIVHNLPDHVDSFDNNVVAKYGTDLWKSFVNDTVENFDRPGQRLWENRIIPVVNKFKNIIGIDDIRGLLSHTAKDYKTDASVKLNELGFGDSKFLNQTVDEVLNEKLDFGVNYQHLKSLVQSKNITHEIFGKLLNKIREHQSNNFHNFSETALKNQYLPTESVSSIYEHAKDYSHDEEATQDLNNLISEVPQVDEKIFKELYDNQREDYEFPGYFKIYSSYPAALDNPVHGYNAILNDDRPLPHGVQNIEQDKLIKTIEEPNKIKSNLSTLLAALPPEGMNWKQIKQQFPKFDQINEIKQFAASKKVVLPEDVAQEIQKHRGADYMVTYTPVPSSTWSSQMHNPNVDTNQFTVQLSNSKKIEDELSKDSKFRSLYRNIQKYANGIGGDRQVNAHPSTPYSMSWARVDTTGGQEGWVIEELQSDFEHYYSQAFEKIMKDKETKLEYSDEELRAYQNKMKEFIKGWEESQYAAVEELARKHGVKNLYMHGFGPRVTMSNYTKKSEIPHGFTSKYEKFPKKQGFEECDYSDYPKTNDGFAKKVKKAGFSTKCWRKKLA
jgi:hypothetical protein